MVDNPTVSTLGIERVGVARFFEHEEVAPAEGQFRVETLFTGLSAGTELSYFKGTNPYLSAGWDRDYGVFRRDRPGVDFPITRLGYMEVGRVTDSRTTAVAPGDLVAMAYGHKTSHVADVRAERFVPLPPELDPVLGIYVAHMGPICANGLLHAAADSMGMAVHDLGDGVRGRHVLVTGAGVVGLLTGLLAKHHGAAIVAIADVTPARLQAAASLGLMALDDRDGQAWREVKDRWWHTSSDRGADVVFQCRGQPSSLATALRSLRPQGTVIDLAFYQDGAPDLRLGEEFHHNGLSIRCAQIARVPRGLGQLWDRRRLAAETIAFLRGAGAAIREHVITDIVPFAEAPSLIADIAARRRHVIQAVFEVV